MNQLVGKKPEHETIYTAVKEMILFGGFVPGQPVTIYGLAETIEAGITPIREAIRRLTAEGALVALENRRVAVPEMTGDRLQQIRLARLFLEPNLTKMAGQNCGAGHIERLEYLDAALNQAIEGGDVNKYLEYNYRFHFSLYSAANAEILLRMTESLWLQIAPSLRVVCGRLGTANLTDRHLEATKALKKGDLVMLEEAVRADISQGMEFVAQTLQPPKIIKTQHKMM